MRLLYLTDQVYLHGGAEKILIQKLNYWAEVYNYEVMLVTSEQKGKPPFFSLSPKVARFDMDMDYPPGSLYHPRNAARFKKHYSKLKQIVSGYAPDAVFVISQTFSRIITPFAAKGFPTYFEYHTSWDGFRMGYEKLSSLHKLKENLIRAIARFAESRYTKIVYLNPTEFDRFNRKNAVVIPNFYDDTQPEIQEQRQNTVITLGRLSFEKQYNLLIESWGKLDGAVEGWELHIYGNGIEKERLEAQLEGTAFKNPVRLLPAVDNVNEKLSRASIYVLSSRVETFPMALLEALSNGLPVVSFDCPTGPRHIITEHEDGLLVEAQNTSALADGLLELMKDPQRRSQMGRAALDNVRRFSPAAVMKKWDELIKANYSKKTPTK